MPPPPQQPSPQQPPKSKSQSSFADDDYDEYENFNSSKGHQQAEPPKSVEQNDPNYAQDGEPLLHGVRVDELPLVTIRKELIDRSLAHTGPRDALLQRLRMSLSIEYKCKQMMTPKLQPILEKVKSPAPRKGAKGQKEVESEEAPSHNPMSMASIMGLFQPAAPPAESNSAASGEDDMDIEDEEEDEDTDENAALPIDLPGPGQMPGPADAASMDAASFPIDVADIMLPPMDIPLPTAAPPPPINAVSSIPSPQKASGIPSPAPKATPPRASDSSSPHTSPIMSPSQQPVQGSAIFSVFFSGGGGGKSPGKTGNGQSGKKLADLRVVDLKGELERRSLATAGNKATLADRLREALEEEGQDPETFTFDEA